MKKFQLGPHMNLYKIGFKIKSVIIREGIEFAAMNRIKTLIIFIYLYKCQELNEAVGVIYILSNKTEISPRFMFQFIYVIGIKFIKVKLCDLECYISYALHTYIIFLELKVVKQITDTKSYFLPATHVIKI